VSSKILGPSMGYIDILDASLKHRSFKESQQPSRFNPLRPSAAGYCSRKLAEEYYDYVNGIRRVAEERTPAVSRLLELGSSIEWHGLKLFKQMDLAAIREAFPELHDLKAFDVRYTQQVVEICELGEGARVEGSMDLCFISDKFKAILDFKSKKVKSVAKWKDDWEITNSKYENMDSVERVTETLFYIDDLVAFLEESDDPFLNDNFYQLNAYAMTEFVKARGIDHASLLYYCKNDSRMREMRFRPSEEIAELVRLKFQFVYDAVVKHSDPTLVPQDYEKGSFRCRYCPWKDHCWGNEKRETAKKAKR